MEVHELHQLEDQYETAKNALRQAYEHIKGLFAAAGMEFKSTPYQENAEPVSAEPIQPSAEPVQPVNVEPVQPESGEKTSDESSEASAEWEAINGRLDAMAATNAKILELLENHEATLKEIQSAQAEKIDAVEKANDEKQERLEHIIQTVQEDRFRKDKGKLINRCIFQAALVSKSIYEYPVITKDMSAEEKEAFLMKQLESVVKGIESMLADEGAKVTNFAKEGEKIDTEHQEVVGVKETDNEALNGTVAEIVSPGYVWTLPYILKAKLNESGEEIKHYRFLMQTEQVIAYKYVKQQ